MREQAAERLHESVLLEESVELLDARHGTVIDATLGLGGHTEAVLRRFEAVEVVGIDQDPFALDHARERLTSFGGRVRLVKSNFADLKTVIERLGVRRVSGVIADLGVSSLQIDSPERGFSFRFEAPLDMRMDPSSEEPTAAELLRTLSESEIADLIYQFGEERYSRRIARRIVERRDRGEPIETTGQLANLVSGAVRKSPKDKIHPATRTFQALRIAVNHETEILEGFIRDAVEILEPGGRLIMITFHSIEDRIVKQTLQRLAGKCFCPPRIPACVCGARKAGEILTKKPTIPSDDEIQRNPRARSAKLRGFVKTAD